MLLIQIWDKESGRCLHTLVGHTAAVTAVTLQDQYVVTGGGMLLTTSSYSR